MRDPLGQLRLRYARLRSLHTGANAEVYVGEEFTGRRVTVVVLAESAATDQELREAFCRAAGALAPSRSALDDYVDRPWAAFHDDPHAAVEILFTTLGEPAPELDAHQLEDTTTNPAPDEEPKLSWKDVAAAPPRQGDEEADSQRDISDPAAVSTAGSSAPQSHPPVPPPPRTPPRQPVVSPPHPPVPPPPVPGAARAPNRFGDVNLPPQVIGAIVVGGVLLLCLVCGCLSRLT